MALHFNKIGIIGKYAAPTVSDTLRQLVRYLQSKKIEIMIDEETAKVWDGHQLQVADSDALGSCDLVIVLGGDGTFLNAARSLCHHKDTALLGLNLGRLGFLTDISPDEFEEKLDRILAGEYLEEDRFLLNSTVIRSGEMIDESIAFNDVVIHKCDVARMIEIDVYIDGVMVNTLRSDGLIISTPTGSTAYALSGGGPLMEAELNAMVLVPICPHTMSNRPIVIDAHSVVEVVIKGTGDAQLSCDGQINQKLQLNDGLIIRKHNHMVRMIHPADHNHFHILRAKLGWG